MPEADPPWAEDFQILSLACAGRRNEAENHEAIQVVLLNDFPQVAAPSPP